jgi:hypothetical protein
VDPRFSVLLPTHDRADVVGHAIRSVLDQTSGDFELLIVGDGCTDGTAAVVLGFGDPRIRWFDLPKGPGFGYANRNVGLREARGDLIAFMAHDDVWLPDHLDVLGARFEAPDVEWAYSRPLWVSDQGLMVPFAVDLTRPAQLNHFLTVSNSIPASCVVHRRTCLDRYGYWPEDVASGADWEQWKAIVGPSAGANIAYVREATTLHFRADWRDPALWGPVPLHRWLGVAAEPRQWPETLNAALIAGETPQASLLRAVQGDPEGRTNAIRWGVSEALDLLAWTQAAELDRLDGALAVARNEAEAWQREAGSADDRAEASVRGADEARRWAEDAVRLSEESARSAEESARRAEASLAEARDARAELAALLGSTSWRLTAPLREARALLRRMAR